MPTFIMLVGLPGAGKSTFAENYLTEYYDAHYLSSDNIRLWKFGNENDQTHNQEVFELMNDSARAVLEQDINVVYDATNTDKTRRAALLASLPECEKICYWLDTPINRCIIRDSMRERKVGEKPINKMKRKFDEPTYDEGWDKIIKLEDR